MEKIKFNLAYNRVAVYGPNGEPKLEMPPGWPQDKTFANDCAIFELSPEEIQQKYGFTFPIQWNDYFESPGRETHSEIFNELNRNYYESQFHNGRVVMKYDLVDNYVQRGEKFHYLIYLMGSTHLTRPCIRIEENVLDAVKKGLCKIVLSFFSEAVYREREHVEWLMNFAGMNDLDSTNFYVVHSNHTFDLTINKMRSWYGRNINFKYISTPYFEWSSWFLNHSSPYNPDSNLRYKEMYDEFVNDNRNKNIRKHFNILNRRPRHHRIVLFTEVMTNPTLKQTTEISLNGDVENLNSNEFVREQLKAISDSYPEYKPNYEFALNHDFLVPKLLDVDLDLNRAGEYTRDFYKNTFCSVTSETLINEDELFFSEKTYKPIFNMHPFLFLGCPNSLKKLKEFGYRTFDKWWDESYDEELDYLLRIKKISKVMQEIATWSHEKCVQVTQEMEEVLIHNFFNYLDNTRYEDFILQLYNNHH